MRGGRSRPKPAVLRLLLRHMMGRSTLASCAADPFSPATQSRGWWGMQAKALGGWGWGEGFRKKRVQQCIDGATYL